MIGKDMPDHPAGQLQARRRRQGDRARASSPPGNLTEGLKSVWLNQ